METISALPSHVPPELAKPFVLTPRKVVCQNPHKALIPEIHQGPPIFYATDVSPAAKVAGSFGRRRICARSIPIPTIS